MNRRQFLVGLLGLLSTAAFGYSQAWLTLAMQPNGKTVQLAVFNGFSLQPWIGVALTFAFLACLMSLYMAPIARRLLLATAALATAANASASAFLALSKSTSPVRTQIDSAINVASAHDISPNDISNDWSIATMSWLALALLAGLMVAAFLGSTKWPIRKNIARSSATSKAKVAKKDPISLWESQR